MKQQSIFLLKASFIGTFAETMLLPVWAALTGRVGGSVLDAGIGYSIFSIITGIVVIVVGKSKWYNNNIRLMIFWGFLISGLGDFAYILVHTVWQLFLVQSVVGLSVGLLNPAWDSLYSEDMDEENGAAKRWSFWTGGISFVTGTAAIVGSLILTYFGWITLFVAIGLTDMVAVVYAYRIYKGEKADGPQN